MILPVIMAGGSGTRLWPLSRGNYPKQFLKLSGDQTMLQSTVTRLSQLEHEPPLLICNEEHRFIAAEQMRQINKQHNGIILEPVGRNTAPAIALAAFKAIKRKQDPLLLVLAADHVINDEDKFIASVNASVDLALEGKLVTFGIVADKPETGYGYIKRGQEVLNSKSDSVIKAYEVSEFVEKPDVNTAEKYLLSGDYFWNSGMFMFKASRYLEELKLHRPDIYQACEQAISVEENDLDFIRIDKEIFETCPDDSIDYAVMEKTSEAVVVPMDADWNDVGGFSALWEVTEKDPQGNALDGDVICIDTKNTLVEAGEKLIATVGVEDLVIVNTKDAVLVAHKNKTQDVKKIVNKLKLEGRSEVKFHREVYRPWGKYDSIDSGERFQVKRITVKPGAKLSVQMHHHRAEHWIVVSGTAKVTNGDKDILLTENQSTYIPVGVIHALENPGKVDLELIEVQSGSYLGEDDIVRFEDKYGRV
mgnify:FL=1